MKSKPFHIFDDEFYDVIGPNPTLTLIATSGNDLLFHEATTWYPPTDEVFFVQNAGAPADGTGLAKSNVVSKISLSQAAAVSSQRNATGYVTVQTLDTPGIINSNGALSNFPVSCPVHLLTRLRWYELSRPYCIYGRRTRG